MDILKKLVTHARSGTNSAILKSKMIRHSKIDFCKKMISIWSICVSKWSPWQAEHNCVISTYINLIQYDAKKPPCVILSARQRIAYSALYDIARPSVKPCKEGWK